ncbi:MAG: hypothetical protein HXX11_20935 [Desulfuromonadales bacterium]|nr:hypothetical protein [Desulfuromonadales bacterium]
MTSLTITIKYFASLNRAPGPTWLAQSQLADLFDVNVPAISKHVRNILASGELDALATVSNMERVQIEGERKVKRSQI